MDDLERNDSPTEAGPPAATQAGGAPPESNGESKGQTWQLTPVVFVDMDGTIRTSAAGQQFINDAADVLVYPGVEDVLWAWKQNGYLIVGISNQGGVAFGHKTMADCDAIMKATLAQFRHNPFVRIFEAYNHPDGTVEPYRHRSLLRKPEYGLIALFEAEAFANRFVVDYEQSVVVGDRPEDVELAQRAGIPFIWAAKFFGREQAPPGLFHTGQG